MILPWVVEVDSLKHQEENIFAGRKSLLFLSNFEELSCKKVSNFYSYSLSVFVSLAILGSIMEL